MRVFSLIVILFATVGCSAKPVQDVGNSVLRGFGSNPEGEIVSGGDSIEQMAQLENISPENEYFIGRSVAAKLLTLYPLVDDEVLTKYVNKVGQSAVAFSDRPETYAGYRFGILDTEEFNAVAAPGGFIFVSRGLLNILPDEDALAAVLAHEISHVSERHALRRISGPDLAAAFTAAGVVAGALTCNEAVASASLVLGAVSDRIVEVLLEKGYSREQEYEADAGAVQILDRAGFDSFALIETLNQLDAVKVNQRAGWFKTHPSNAERRAALSGSVRAATAKGADRGLREARFARIMQPIR